MNRYISIWDPIVRFIHWLLVAGFILNYFLLESGGDLHQIVGYVAFCTILIRIIWGLFSKGYAGFSHLKLSKRSFASHLSHLRNRKIPVESGHNPLGWLMVLLTWGIFIALAVTGFLLEEVDYFFGSSQIEYIHSLLADFMYALALIHVAAILLVSYIGKISLIPPMITGKRKR